MIIAAICPSNLITELKCQLFFRMNRGCPVLTDQFYFNKVSVHMCASPEAMQRVKDWINTEPSLVFVSRSN